MLRCYIPVKYFFFLFLMFLFIFLPKTTSIRLTFASITTAKKCLNKS